MDIVGRVVMVVVVGGAEVVMVVNGGRQVRGLDE